MFGLQPLHIVIILVVALWFFSVVHAAFSARSSGGAKVGWVILCWLFPYLGWAVFLFVTRSKKGVLVSGPRDSDT